MRQYGILAYPAGHSLSPALHNALFEIYSIDAKYERFEVRPESLKQFMGNLKGIDGLSVSLPHKQSVMPYLDSIDDKAKEVDAVNTIVRTSNKLTGYNTDVDGFIFSLKKHVQTLDQLPVIVLGAGGACKAVIYGLLEHNTKIIAVYNRSPKIVSEALGTTSSLEDLKSLKDLPANTVFINTTSVWNNGESHTPESLESMFPQSVLSQCSLIMDLAYKPEITYLSEQAAQHNIKYVNGLEMFLNQAALQFQLWTGIMPEYEVLYQIFLKNSAPSS